MQQVAISKKLAIRATYLLTICALVLSVFYPITKAFAVSTTIQSGCTVGSSSSCPGDSAIQIKLATGTTTNGTYWINVNGIATQIYCIMDDAMDGGGWMMVMKAANTGTTFNYGASYWTDTSTTYQTTNLRRNDGSNNEDAKFNSFNYTPANRILAIFPDASAGGAISGQTYGFTWLESTTASNQTMISLFNGPEYKIRDANAASPYRADGNGIFSIETGISFFGFNFVDGGSNNKTRFGIGTNNEQYWGSNDTRGGIGLDFNSWSAGDNTNCCAVTAGVQRQMKFEMYVKNTATTYSTANPTFSSTAGTAGGATFAVDTSTISAESITVSDVTNSGRTLSVTDNGNGTFSITGALANDQISIALTYYAKSGYKGTSTINTTVNATSGATGASISIGAVNKLNTTTITVAVSPSSAYGTVNFYWNNRIINRCSSRTVTTGTATCTWKPMTQGQGVLTATFSPSDGVYQASSATPKYVVVGKRTGTR